MTIVKLHRVQEGLTGKRLSAQTIASLILAQGVRRAEDLSTSKTMNAKALLFLNRATAIRHWTSNGWLENTGVGLRLTATGKEKVLARVTGGAGPQSVTEDMVVEAIDVILHGNGSQEPSVIIETFDL